MQIDITPSDISFVALQGGDIHRFIALLRIAQSPFARCVINTCWGLMVFQFSGPEGRCTCSVNIALLDITKEMVVNDSGQYVDRYEKIIEELLKRASDKLKLPETDRELKKRDAILIAH